MLYEWSWFISMNRLDTTVVLVADLFLLGIIFENKSNFFGYDSDLSWKVYREEGRADTHLSFTLKFESMLDMLRSGRNKKRSFIVDDADFFWCLRSRFWWLTNVCLRNLSAAAVLFDERDRWSWGYSPIGHNEEHGECFSFASLGNSIDSTPFSWSINWVRLTYLRQTTNRIRESSPTSDL